MFTMFTIKATKREGNTDLTALRANGEIPAVFYGMGKETTSISIPSVLFKKVWEKAGESSTVSLETPSGTFDTLIHEVQVNPVTDAPIHVDFLVIDVNKSIKVNIPLEFVGVAPAIKGGLGTLVKVLHEVEVEALPKNLPHSIEVDISSLENVNDHLIVADIKAPTGVSVITPSEEIMVSIGAIQEEKEETAPVDLSSIEVEKKGKKEEEETPTE